MQSRRVSCLAGFGKEMQPKSLYWGENRTNSKIYESTRFLNARGSGTDVTVGGKQFQLLTTLHVKLFSSSVGSPGFMRQS